LRISPSIPSLTSRAFFEGEIEDRSYDYLEGESPFRFVVTIIAFFIISINVRYGEGEPDFSRFFPGEVDCDFNSFPNNPSLLVSVVMRA
jgi:hypothetical protein